MYIYFNILKLNVNKTLFIYKKKFIIFMYYDNISFLEKSYKKK